MTSSRALGKNPRALGTNPRARRTARARAARLASLPYALYLKTEHWRKLRARVLERWGGYCENCGTAAALEVHHKTYDRLGRERLSDLTPLCPSCHRATHDLPAPR